jgi:hypothetical protein
LPLLIVGDINVHLDVVDDPHAVRLEQLLEGHRLVQHVQTPTHVNDHLLDVVISRDDMPVRSLRVDPPGILSDHSLIVGQLQLTTVVGLDETQCVRRRYWRQFDVDAFTVDLQRSVARLQQLPSPDVNKLFANYDS